MSIGVDRPLKNNSSVICEYASSFAVEDVAIFIAQVGLVHCLIGAKQHFR